MQLTTENVLSVFCGCLFTDDEIKDLVPGETPPDTVLATGLTVKIGFKKDRLESHKEEIKNLLSQVPDEFFHDKGGGMSFLKLPFLKDDSQWGEHKAAQELMLMGLASGLMKRCAPAAVEASVFVGIPYLVINLDGFPE